MMSFREKTDVETHQCARPKPVARAPRDLHNEGGQILPRAWNAMYTQFVKLMQI